MLKKKNIATMMAAATVVTSVAPVFAAQVEADADVLERISETSTTLTKGEDATKQLIDDLRLLLTNGTKFDVDGGEYTYNSTTTKSNVKGDSVYGVVLVNEDDTETPIKSVVELENKIAALKSVNGSIDSLTIRIFNKGYGIAEVDGKEVVSGLNDRREDISVEKDINKITIVATDANTKVFALEDLYDGEYITEAGFGLYSALRKEDNKNLIDSSEFGEIFVSEANGTKIENFEIKVKEDPKLKEQTIEFYLTADYVDTNKENEVYKIVINGTNMTHTNELAKILNKDDDYKIGASRIAGMTRFETAIKIAKENFEITEAADYANIGTTQANIVLVNEDAMIDGLAAAPLAKVLNAPVLLTGKDSVQKDTLDFVKEVKASSGKETKVTIVGGEGVVSNNVVRELEKAGIKVERIGGEDRHATSVEVGIKMRSLDAKFQIDDAFIVAATGEADAMSIAPVAAKLDAPIIVEGFNGMSTTAKELLKNAKENKSVDIIGGKVSKETQEFYAKSGDFVYGEDRKDTNAKVVEKYFSNVDHIYVAKDGYVGGNGQLVDALAVGTLAAKDSENAAIILSTDGLTARQKEAVKSVAKDGAEVKQIGGGVNFSTTVKAVAKILRFTK